MTTADFFAIGSTVSMPPDGDGTPGRTFTLRKLTQEEQGHFQKWLEQREHDAVDRSEDTEDRKLKRHHLIDVAAGLGKYEVDGEYGLEAQWTVAGMVKMTSLALREQGVTELMAREIVRHSVREVAAELIGRETSDPKAIALARLALGLGALNATPPSAGSGSSETTSSPPGEPTPKSPDSPTPNSSTSTDCSAPPTH